MISLGLSSLPVLARAPDVYAAIAASIPSKRDTTESSEVNMSAAENPRTPLSQIFSMEPNPAGISVTERTSLQLAAVWRCNTLISGAIGRTPFLSFERTDMGKELARGHYTWPLFTREANPHMTSYRFRRLMQTWVNLWGNAYAEIQISGRGQVIGLWPWRPDRVTISLPGGGTPDAPLMNSANSLIYTYTTSGGTRVSLPGDYILHLRGLETDGIMGLSPIRAARRSIALAAAAEEYGARYFGSGSTPGGILEHPGKVGKQAAENLRSSWEDIHRGLKGSHRLGILEEGMKYHEVGIPPEDMQFLQTRQFQAIDIARLFGVPPHKIAELSRATFSNIEHQSIEFVSDCLADWFANWESQCTSSLLSQREVDGVNGLGGIELEFQVDRLMRGDMRGRYAAYATGRQWGWLSKNEIREKESMNRIADGDDYLTPLNMTSQAEPPADPVDPEAADPDGEAQRMDALEAEIAQLREEIRHQDYASELRQVRLALTERSNGNGHQPAVATET